MTGPGQAEAAGQDRGAVTGEPAAMLWQAVAYHQRGNVPEAERLYREILVLSPTHFDALHLLGVLAAQRGDFSAAVASIALALRVRPDDVSAHANMGTALRDLGRAQEALAHLDHALRIEPNHVGALSSRGDVMRDLGRPRDALACYEAALRIDPDHVGTLNNRGVTLASLGFPHEALACYQRVFQLQVDHADAHWNASLAFLQVGDWKSGWREYEWRWTSKWLKGAWRDFGRPLWTGAAPLRGKSILLWGEQGLGDTIQFSRLVKAVAARGASVVLTVQPRLRALMMTLDGVDRLLADGEPVPDTDYQCPLLSLPLGLGIDLADLPGEIPYLHCDPALLAKWGDRLGERRRPRVGLVWSGNPAQAYDRRRSIPLQTLLQIADGAFEFVCLQNDITEPDRGILADRPDVRTFRVLQEGLHDAAALVQHMDLVITVDTAIAHLAGALGRPVWILLPCVPDWRWMLGRPDTPWYQTARLFRQPVEGDWQSVMQQVKQALAAMTELVSRNDMPVAALLEQAVSLHRQRDLPGAALAYQKILVLEPRHFDALHLLGVLEAQRANLPASVALIGQALAVRPDDARAHANMGTALRDLQRPADALAHLDRALRADPDQTEAWYNRGNILADLSRPTDALASYDRVLSLDARHVRALIARTAPLLALGRPDAALASLDRALALVPDDPDALDAKGNVLLELHRPEEALASYDHSLQVRPSHTGTLVNRGLALWALERPSEALASHEQALAIEPNHFEALCNRARMLRELQRLDAAIEAVDDVLRVAPESAEFHFSAAIYRLLAGDFTTGWREYEWRWRFAHLQGTRPDFGRPTWLGQESLDGKSILLLDEQGFGDTIQFCRLAKSVSDQGARVVLRVQPPLASLLASLEKVDTLLTHGDAMPETDFQCPLMSLPLALHIDLPGIPAPRQYLRCDATHIAKWADIIGERRRPRIGLAWSGNESHLIDRKRSIALEQFLALATGPYEFISLQPEIRAADQPLLDQRRDIRTVADKISDFQDTAALIHHLDLVITVDTAVAHLAAALGAPTWVLLPFVPDWRWLLDRSDSPWYPTMTLFRQPAMGDWHSVTEQVQQALSEQLRSTAHPC